MKIPRDLNSDSLIKFLHQNGFETTRQTGSHIRLSRVYDGKKQSITIPHHNPIKIGTLNNILVEIAKQFSISKNKLLEMLLLLW